MKSNVAIPLHVLVSSLLVILSKAQDFIMLPKAQDFDFFYFVREWHPSYCDTKRSCCYPTTGKPPADFGIHGLWPNYNTGSYPSDCDPDSPFNPSERSESEKQKHIEDLISELQTNWPTLSCPSDNGTRFWKHEWEKHGTCSESVLDQHAYFQAALNLKKQVDLLQILTNAGIEPDGAFYSPTNISDTIREATGFTPAIQCNKDEERNSQLYQSYQCVDTSGTKFIECPVLPKYRCPKLIEFPAF